MSQSSTLPVSARSTMLARCIPVFTLLLPILVSIGIFVTRDKKAFGNLRSYVENNRATVSVLVQVFSSVMGILQMATLTSLINFATRIRLTETSMQLDTVGLMTALTIPRIPWNLPITSLCIAILIVVVAQGPGALWAGALTPIIQTELLKQGDIHVPVFGASTSRIWDSQFEIREGYVWNILKVCSERPIGNLSTISNCPAPNYQGFLLDTARQAINPPENPRNHSKPDNPGWTYHGRSYGVGSPQGLDVLGQIPAEYKLVGYNYQEAGYHTRVRCQHNATTNLTAERLERTVSEVQVWAVTGYLPNSFLSEYQTQMTWWREETRDTELLAWVGVSNNNSHMIGIVATDYYGDFKQIECSVDFAPTLFDIGVNTTQQSIVVSLSNSSITDMDTTGHLKRNAVLSMNLLSRMSTSLYVSVLGEALKFSASNMQRQFPGLNTREAALRATESSFEAMIDDILGIYSGAQLAISHDFKTTDISGKYRCIVLGRPLFHYAVAAVNLVLLLSIVFEASRTRWWRRLPKWDNMDFKSIVAASSFGGTSISREIETYHANAGSKWRGDSSDRYVGGLKVQLQETPHAISLVLSSTSGKLEYLPVASNFEEYGMQAKLPGLQVNESSVQFPTWNTGSTS